jgi:hypothetical protein
MLRSSSRSSGHTDSSPSSSPQKKNSRLSMAGVANLFTKMRRLEDRSIHTDELELSSGDPKTHPNVAESAKDQNKIPVEQTDHFVCAGGVNLSTLLRITRIALMENAERELGANSVVDEQCVYSSCLYSFYSCSLLLYNSDGNAPFPDRSLCKAESTKYWYGLCSHCPYALI